MNDDSISFLRESAIQLIKECEDEDLLDLVCKLFLELGSNG